MALSLSLPCLLAQNWLAMPMPHLLLPLGFRRMLFPSSLFFAKVKRWYSLRLCLICLCFCEITSEQSSCICCRLFLTVSGDFDFTKRNWYWGFIWRSIWIFWCTYSFVPSYAGTGDVCLRNAGSSILFSVTSISVSFECAITVVSLLLNCNFISLWHCCYVRSFGIVQSSFPIHLRLWSGQKCWPSLSILGVQISSWQLSGVPICVAELTTWRIGLPCQF